MIGHARRRTNRARAFDFDVMALPVSERQRVHGEALGLRDGQRGRRIEPAADQHDRRLHGRARCLNSTSHS